MNTTIAFVDGEARVLSAAEARRYRGLSTERLLAIVAEGDESAGLFLVFHRFGYVLKRLTDKYAESDCHDTLFGELVSEVYTHFATKGWARMLPADLSNIGGYLYAVERNLLLQIQRRDCRHIAAAGKAEETLCVQQTLESGEEALAAVQRVMARLSETRRFVLNKRMVEGYASKEVAEMLPDFWRSIGERHSGRPTYAYVDNMVSAARRELRGAAL